MPDNSFVDLRGALLFNTDIKKKNLGIRLEKECQQLAADRDVFDELSF